MTGEIAAYLLRDYHVQWTALLVAIACATAWWMRSKVGSLATAALLYCTINAMYVWVWNLNRYYPVHPYDLQALRFHAADALLKLLILAMPIFLMERRVIAAVGRWVWPSLFWANAAAIILERVFIQDCSAENVCGGIVGNPSMSASFLATVLPLAWSWPAALAAVVAVFITKSSLGLGLLAVAIAIQIPVRRLVWGVVPLALTMGAGYLCLGAELYNPSDRFRIWVTFMDMWDAPWNIPFGMGYGTFPPMSLNLQHELKMPDTKWWFFMHNDWLEMLFVGGAAGALLLVALYLNCLDRLWARRDWKELRAVILYGLFMFFNYPSRLAITSALGVYLIAMSVRRDPLYFGGGQVHNHFIRRFHEGLARYPRIARISERLRSFARRPFPAGDRQTIL